MTQRAVRRLVRSALPWICFPLPGIVTGCHIPPGAGDSEVVTNLRFSPSAFDSFKRNTELRFTLRSPGTISISIVRDASGAGSSVVKTLIVNERETGGTHAVTWLGDTNAGSFAPAGVYLGLVEVSGQRFSTSVQVFHF